MRTGVLAGLLRPLLRQRVVAPGVGTTRRMPTPARRVDASRPHHGNCRNPHVAWLAGGILVLLLIAGGIAQLVHG